MKDTRLMAEQTWPLFERKWRRMQLRQRWKNKIFFAGTVLLIVILTLLYRTLTLDQKGINKHFIQPKKEQNLIPKAPKKRIGRTQLKTVSLLGTEVFDSMTAPIEPLFFKLNPKFQIPFQQKWQGFIQKNADLQLACAQLNLRPVSWSVQANGHSLSALLDDQTLMIMNLMYGTEILPAYPLDFLTESWYRPDFFPADQFIHVAFYEVTDWIQDPISVKLSMNRVSNQTNIAPWRTSSNLTRNMEGSQYVISALDRENPGIFMYRNQDRTFDRNIQMQYRKNFFVADRPAESFNPLLYHHSDTLIVVSAQAQRITKLSMNGILFGSTEITFKSKGIHSVKRFEPLLDPVDNTLYVLVPTNFHFVIYKVDCASGVAQEVFQTPTVWKGAEFEIFDGILHYNYKAKEIQIDLAQIKVE